MAVGRPTVATPEARKKFLAAIRAGNYREVAAKYAGISMESMKRFLRKNDEESVAFRSAIQEAETAVEIEIVGCIYKLAKGDLKAATWYLSHKFPERWADQSRDLKELLKLLKERERNAKSGN